MKKSVFLILAVLLAFTLLFAACNNGKDPQPPNEEETTDQVELPTETTTAPNTEPHAHAFGEWTTIKEATCTEQGEQQRSCACGEVETQSLDALGHTEVVDAAVEPTCTETGLTEGTHCSVCEQVLLEQTVFPALGHAYTAVVTAPTCTEQGYTAHTCHCGDTYVDSYVEATGHSYGDWFTTTAPTCTESGTERRDCEDCDHYEAQGIAASGHAYTTVVTAPTCTEQGYTTHTCHCGDSYVDSYVEATGHHYGEWIVSVHESCTEDGERYRACADCPQRETEGIEAHHTPSEFYATGEYCGLQALGYTTCVDCFVTLAEFDHAYETTITQASCTEQGKIVRACMHCDSSFTQTLPASGHILGEWVEVSAATCTAPGQMARYCMSCQEAIETLEIAVVAHTYTSTATAESVIYTCSHCGDSYSVATTQYVTVSFICDGEKLTNDLQVAKGKAAKLPAPTKEGYVFSGWYLDEELTNACLDTYTFGEDTTLYAAWISESLTEQASTNNLVTHAPLDFTFKVNSKVVLTDSNLSQYVFVTDINDVSASLYVVSAENGVYTVGSHAYKAGMTYRVTLGDQVSFVDVLGEELWFITARENVFNVRYDKNTKLIPESGICASYESEGNIYFLMEVDCLNVGDNAIVYRGEDQNDISMVFTVVMEGIYGDLYYYMIDEADYDAVFDELDYYYSGQLSVEGMEFDENLGEELTEQLMRSSLYARFNAAATAFSGTKEGDFVYQLKNTSKPQISYKAEGKTVYFSIKVVAEFEKKNVKTQETDSVFTITMEISTELKFDFVAQIDGLEKVSMVADVKNTTKVNLFASVDDEYSNTKELNYFKKFFDDAKKTGSYTEIDASSASSKKEIPIGKLPIAGIPGITLSVNVTNVFDFEAVGEIGIEAQLDVSAKFGLQYVSGKGVSAIKSFDAEARVTFYMMGKMTISDTLKVELNVNALGVINGYISATVGPYVEVGGMASATFSTTGVHSAVAGGYIDIGITVDAEIGANAKVNVFGKTISLFDKTLTLYSEEFLLLSIGQKQVPIRFLDPKDEFAFESACSIRVNLSELVDTSILIQDLEDMSKKTETPDCIYYLNGNYSGVFLSMDGVLTATGDFNEQIISVKVVYGAVFKIIEVKLTVSHHVAESPYRAPTCTEQGQNGYTYCLDCRRILSGVDSPIPELGHSDLDYDLICDTCDAKLLEPGLYDASGNMLASWDELVNVYGMDIEKGYGMSSYKTDAASPYCVLTNNPELANGTILQLGNVLEIDDYAFYNCAWLTHVILSESVQKIDFSAFRGCSGLQSIRIPASVTGIGEDAFYDCSSLRSIVISEGVTSIGDYAFYRCKKLTSVIFPDSVKTVGHSVMKDCTSLKNAVIGDGLAEIGMRMFEGCYNLRSVELGSNVIKIGLEAFDGCSSLTAVNIPDGMTVIDEYAFYGCSGLVNFVIPEGVTRICTYAFAECSGLESIVIPQSVTTIDYRAFWDCSSLTSIAIPDKVTSINGLFSGCSSLESVIIGNGVISISSHSFSGCTSLTSITIPDSVTTISNQAFDGCTGLRRIVFGKGVSSIGSLAFNGCSALTEIVIGDCTASFSGGMFDDCANLTSFIVSDSNSVYHSAGNSLIKTATNTLVVGGVNCEIPDYVTKIGSSAFLGRTGLTSIVIPVSVTNIDGGAFSGCTGLTDVYYTGTAAEWALITIYGSSNDCLTNATIHYNYAG